MSGPGGGGRLGVWVGATDAGSAFIRFLRGGAASSSFSPTKNSARNILVYANNSMYECNDWKFYIRSLTMIHRRCNSKDKRNWKNNILITSCVIMITHRMRLKYFRCTQKYFCTQARYKIMGLPPTPWFLFVCDLNVRLVVTPELVVGPRFSPVCDWDDANVSDFFSLLSLTSGLSEPFPCSNNVCKACNLTRNSHSNR